MLEVSEAALVTIKEWLQPKKNLPSVRVTVKDGSCSGPSLRISVDEAEEGDQIFEMPGVRFVVDKELLSSCGSIQIDHSASQNTCCCSGGCGGFRISGEKRFLFSDRCRVDTCDGACRCDASA